MITTGEKNTLKDFFESFTEFHVPYYQRNYSWKDKQVFVLMDDIFQSMEKYKNKKNHFLGIIVSKKSIDIGIKQKFIYELIDGQQRITTISLFIKYLLKYIEKNFFSIDENLINLLNSFLYKNLDDSFKKRIRLQLDNEHQDHTIFSEIIEEKSVSNINNLIYIAYKKIEKYFSEKVPKEHKINEIINFLTNMQIVHIILEDKEDNPQNVFESLNSKGMSLSNIDLIKNYLFMNISEKSLQNQLYTRYWKYIENNVKKVGEIEKFFRFLIILKKNSYIDKKGQIIFEEFRNHYNDITEENIEKTLSEIKYFLKIYISITKNYSSSVSIKNDENSLLYKNINDIISNYYNDSDLLILIWMYLSDKYINLPNFRSKFKKIVNLFDKYVIRWAIGIGQGHLLDPSIKIIKKMNEAIDREKKEKNIDESNDKFDLDIYVKSMKLCILNDLSGQFRYVNDNDIKLRFFEQFKERLSKYILKKIEFSNNTNIKNLTLEHIRPKDILNDKDNRWEKYENHKVIIKKLGNLCLLEKELNEECNNKYFEEKREIYKKSKTYLAPKIANTNWNIEAIDNRTSELFNQFNQIFSIL